MQTLKLTKNMLIKAIEGSNGIILIIAQRLKVDRKTITNYLKRYPELKELIDEEKENIIDFAESKLIKRIQEEDAWAIKFFLINQGQARGYGKEITENNEKFKEVVINFLPPVEKKDEKED